jgi:hypothetical protein
MHVVILRIYRRGARSVKFRYKPGNVTSRGSLEIVDNIEVLALKDDQEGREEAGTLPGAEDAISSVVGGQIGCTK